MWILVISLVLLAVVARVLGIICDKRIEKKIADSELTGYPEAIKIDSECCGQHE
ncbi:hypothetical protein EZS27_042453, partial [termite gut metagenome]